MAQADPDPRPVLFSGPSCRKEDERREDAGDDTEHAGSSNTLAVGNDEE
jgi:hypothetical protein